MLFTVCKENCSSWGQCRQIGKLMAGARNGNQQGLGSQPHRRTTGSRLVSNLFSWEAVEKLIFIRGYVSVSSSQRASCCTCCYVLEEASDFHFSQLFGALLRCITCRYVVLIAPTLNPKPTSQQMNWSDLLLDLWLQINSGSQWWMQFVEVIIGGTYMRKH